MDDIQNIQTVHYYLNNLWSGGEGHSGHSLDQTLAIASIVKILPLNARVLEIGFNCGHSAATMLCSRSDISILSLDLGLHEYVPKAKLVLDQLFPGRHELILGDSTKTVEDVKGNFDMFFIDGGHEYEIALKDAKNCLALARPTDIIVIDDVCEPPLAEYTIGPSLVWREMKDSGRIREVEHKEFEFGMRGWSWGFPTRKGVKVN